MSHIVADKKEAVWVICTRLDEVKIFKDGSGLDNQVGAAAVVGSGHQGTILSYHLGSLEHHTVFEGKLMGVIFGLYILCSLPPSFSMALIALDSQAAITMLTSNQCQPSQYLLDEIHTQLLTL